MTHNEVQARFGGVDVCPFCACRSPQLYLGRMYHVTCPACKADGPIGRDAPEAIIKWNERRA